MPSVPMNSSAPVGPVRAPVASAHRPPASGYAVSAVPFLLALTSTLTLVACGSEPAAPAPAEASANPIGSAFAAPGPEPQDPKARAAALRASVHEKLDCRDCHSPTGAGSRIPGAGGRTVAIVDCKSCHEKEAETFSRSVHATAHGPGKAPAAACSDCHGSHDIRPQSDPKSRVFKANLPSTCGRCHGDPAVAQDLGIANPRAAQHYVDSIHGQRLVVEGKTDAPSCIDCHGGGHGMLRATNPASSVFRTHVTATCGNCHDEQQAALARSVHGQKLAEADAEAPVCTNCHSAHEVAPVEGYVRLRASVQCGKCHEPQLQDYANSYHGRLLQRGGDAAAGCFDCHGAHEIHATDDPQSTVAPDRRAATCRKCHASAPDQFASFVAHGDSDDPVGDPLLFWTKRLVSGAVIAAALGWLAALLLRLLRALRDTWRDPLGYRQAARERHEAQRQRYHPRLRRVDRLCLAVTSFGFVVLVATGLPLKFDDATWANSVFRTICSASAAASLHRVAAVVTLVAALLHLATLLLAWRRRGPTVSTDGQVQARPTFKAYALGPDSPLLSWPDVRAAASVLRGRPAPTDATRFSRWEKLGYCSALGGGAVLALTGLAKWFPETFTLLLPGWTINLAQIVHSQGALLAVAAVLTFYLPFRATEAKLAELDQEAAEAEFAAALPPGVQMTRPPKGHPLADAWLVLVLSVVFGATLALVEVVLGGGDRDLELTLDQVPTLVPGATTGEPDESLVPGRRVFRALDDSGKLVGWVVQGQGQGYADKIDLLVGLDPKATTLTGLYVLRHKETPGLGDGITSPEFLGQFSGVSTSLTLLARQAPADKTTGVIKALTGATISSGSVCNIVNETVAAVKEPLAAAAE